MPSQGPLSVHLVRHGETEWNRDGRCQGVTDIPLTPKGLGAQLLGEHTEFFHRWQQDPAHTPPPGGETLETLQSRAWPVVDRLREQACDGSMVVVSHTMTIATILCAALGLDLGNIHHLKIDLASRSTIVFSQFGLFSLWRLASLNDRHHLTDRLR